MKEETLAPVVPIGNTDHPAAALPEPIRIDEALGLAVAPGVEGQVIHRNPGAGLFETRATITPGGDYLLMFPDALPGAARGHYGSQTAKVNNLIAYRSQDRGATWTGPTLPFDIDYNQHGFIPLIPRGGTRLYAFGTQPVWGLWTQTHGLGENAPLGYRTSDDDGHTWSEVRLIRPVNDPDFRGMSVMRMCETEKGTWLLGSHEGDWSYRPLMTRQYVLRSADQGATWEVLPHPRHGGWHCPGFNRMDEGRPIHIGGDEVYLMVRTPEGRLWQSRSLDDGQTWEDPTPTPLVHPDAPPMLFHLGDGQTLAAFHHNRHNDTRYSGLSGEKTAMMKDRAEVWVALSRDGGRSWSEPRFVYANALAETEANAWCNYQCAYNDMFVDDGVVHLFVPHRWRRALHLTLPEAALDTLPTRKELGL